MSTIEFGENDIEQLRHERFEHPHPQVQRKMEALLLKSEGLPHHQITRILGVSENTLRHYLQEYQDGGHRTALKRFDFTIHEVSGTSIAHHWKTTSRYIRRRR